MLSQPANFNGAIGRVCVVADRGMISAATIAGLVSISVSI
jgi:hypothetical protein